MDTTDLSGSIQYEILVEGALVGRTVRSILQNKLRLSRRQLRNLITTNGVFRNGEAVYLTSKVEDGDIIFVMLPKEDSDIAPEALSIDVRYEDGECLVANKGMGVLTHPTARERNGSLLAGVYNRIQPQVPHCVHRLDRDTTGLVLFARHGHFHHLFDETLRSGKIHRMYTALVHLDDDIDLNEWDIIDLPIAQDPRSPSRRIISASGQRSITHYKVLARAGDIGLVFIALETGRTHQIRLHFSALGRPLLGDTVYGHPRKDGAALDTSSGGTSRAIRYPDRQALHGIHLWFVHPVTDEEQHVHAAPPADMLEWWRWVGGRDEDWPNSEETANLLVDCPIFANIENAERS